eukprot:GHVS01059231.1.p1 GENE.GHVS01059231.1~~GHVS01059231.1.p1  ORF type:complete len:659 (-),score=132.78 GHVS01059231.1:859-2835(-)
MEPTTRDQHLPLSSPSMCSSSSGPCPVPPPPTSCSPNVSPATISIMGPPGAAVDWPPIIGGGGACESGEEGDRKSVAVVGLSVAVRPLLSVEEDTGSVLSVCGSLSCCSTCVPTNSRGEQEGGDVKRKGRRARRLVGKKRGEKDERRADKQEQQETDKRRTEDEGEKEQVAEQFDISPQDSAVESVINIASSSDEDDIKEISSTKGKGGRGGTTSKGGVRGGGGGTTGAAAALNGGRKSAAMSVDVECLVERLSQTKCSKRISVLSQLGNAVWDNPDKFMEWINPSRANQLVLELVASICGAGGSKVSSPEAVLAADIAAGILLTQPPHSISQSTYETVAPRLRSTYRGKGACDVRASAVSLMSVLTFVGSDTGSDSQETVEWLKKSGQAYKFAETVEDGKNDLSSNDAQAVLWSWTLLASQWRKSQLADLSHGSDARSLWQFCERCVQRADLDLKHGAGLCMAMIFESIWATRAPDGIPHLQSSEACKCAVEHVEFIASTSGERCRGLNKEEKKTQLKSFRSFCSTISEGTIPSVSICIDTPAGGSQSKVDLLGHISSFRYCMLKRYLKGSTSYYLKHQPHLLDAINASSSLNLARRMTTTAGANSMELFDAPLNSEQPAHKGVGFDTDSRNGRNKMRTRHRGWMRDRKDELREVVL